MAKNVNQNRSSTTIVLSVEWTPWIRCVVCTQQRVLLVAVFCNMLDLAGINAWILFKTTLDSVISRRQFLQDVATELCQRDNPVDTDHPEEEVQDGACVELVTAGKRKHCHAQDCKNKTTMKCYICSKFVCGKCSGAKKKMVQVACNNCVAEWGSYQLDGCDNFHD